MSEIRCQMCGKSSSDELDICPFCQARLKPLFVPPPEEIYPNKPVEKPVKDVLEGSEVKIPEPEVPAAEQLSTPEAIPAEGEETFLESDLPPWLQDMRAQSVDKLSLEESIEPPTPVEEPQPVEPEAEKPPVLPEVEVPDFLSGLERTNKETDQLPSWMVGLRIPEKKEESSPEPSSTEPKEGSSNWLNQLRGETPIVEESATLEKPESAPEEPIYSEGIPDWMKDLQKQVDSRMSGSKPEEEQPESVAEDSPDWLLQLQAETQADTTEEDQPEQEPESSKPVEKPGIVGTSPVVGDEKSEAEADVPNWLKNLQTESPIPENKDIPFENEKPDWLTDASLETTQPVGEVQSIDPGMMAEGSSLDAESLDWLKEVAEKSKPPSDDDGSFKSDLETPDWLKDLPAEKQAQPEDGIQPATDMPDWLKKLENKYSQVSNQEGDLQTELEAMDGIPPLPGTHEPIKTLEDLIPGKQPEGSTRLDEEAGSTQETKDSEFQPGMVGELPNTELMPEWLDGISKTGSTLGETTDLLGEEISTSDETGTSDVPVPEIPDWLSSAKSSEPGEQLGVEPAVDDQSSELITPANLPSWVQAMRPVESMVAEIGIPTVHADQTPESSGPLAGLRGVLPAAPEMEMSRKPLNYSNKLRISDDQNQQASRLKQMLEGETQAKGSATAGKVLSKRVLRWIVTGIVLLAICIPAFSGMQVTPPPSLYPPELIAAREVLFGLAPNSAVLLVFDYEPAFSGELEVTAAPLVDNLMITGVRLAMVSTSPTGPALAEHFLKTTQSQHNYQSGTQYTNLGYLSGGASGILSFSSNPSQTLPQAVDGSSPWQTPFLQDIQNLADFSAVIVLTDNADTARIWVEQAGNILGQTPLLMAISSQVEPMIRPYYDSKQIKGLVTGLAGGKAYEQTMLSTGLGQQYWDSYSSGLFIAELIILFGSLWGLISIWRNRGSAPKEEV